MIPKVIRLDLAYRDHSNHRECKAYEFSNAQGVTEDSIIAAFDKIGNKDVIPYKFGLPCDLAPTLHPDEPTYEGDHCYIEISQLSMRDDVQPDQYLLHCDISDIVEAINKNGSDEWLTLEENIKADKIAAAKKLLLDEGDTVSSPDNEIALSIIDEVKGDDIVVRLNTMSNLGVAVSFDGHSDCCSEDNVGTPLYIEKYDGKLRVLLYADINSEEPSHLIDLSGAKNSNRKGGELMEKVLTVVLRYGTDATLPKELLQAMTDGTEVGGCKVTAASFDDEIARVEQFEEKEFDIST